MSSATVALILCFRCCARFLRAHGVESLFCTHNRQRQKFQIVAETIKLLVMLASFGLDTSALSNRRRSVCTSKICILAAVALVSTLLASGQEIESAVRVVRFRIDYHNADLTSVSRLQSWPTVMRKSVLASLKFVNKHWTICGASERLEKALG